MGKLYRSSTDSVIGGVCGGIAEWLGWNSTAIRIFWFMLTMVDVSIVQYSAEYDLTIGNFFFTAYIVLWMVLKED